MTLILPVSLVLSRRFYAKPKVGFCSGCGYDLRETPGRCPECGAVPIP